MRIDAGHLAPLEAPHAFAHSIDKLLSAEIRSGMPRKSSTTPDLPIGVAYWAMRGSTDSLAKRTPFDAEFQEMITRIAWGEVWGRAGLDERTRRLLVVAVTASARPLGGVFATRPRRVGRGRLFAR